MSKRTEICPICGSEKVERFETISKAQLTVGPSFTFHEIYYKCSTCHEESDIFAETDKNYLKAQKEAEAQWIKDALNQLADLGISMAFFERAFELPIRTLTRWKTGDFSSTSLALLRVMKTYPWMVEVAAHNFDPLFAQKSMQETLVPQRIIFNLGTPLGESSSVSTLISSLPSSSVGMGE